MAIAFARVSTPRQAREGQSLEAQEAELQSAAPRFGCELVRAYVEPGISAYDDGARPIFDRMVEDIKTGATGAGTILVTHGSRLFRNALKAALFRAEMERLGVRVIATQQPLPEGPEGKLLQQLCDAINEYESANSARRVVSAMRANARAGFWNGSRAPFGHSIEKVPGPGGNPKAVLRIDPHEADTVRSMLAQYLGNKGAVSIAAELNAFGNRCRGRLWTRDLVLRVISSTSLIGQARWGRRCSRTGALRPESEVETVRCEPIVDRDLFERVQAERARRDPVKNGRGGSSPLLLGGGLLRCGQCGASLELQTSGKPRPDGERYAYYMCSKARRTGVGVACSARPLSVEVADATVLAHLADAVFSHPRCAAILRELSERDGALWMRARDERRRWEAEERELSKRQARLVDALESGSVEARLVGDRLRDVEQKLGEARERLAKVTPLHQAPPWLGNAVLGDRFAARLRSALRGDRQLAGAYLRALVQHIIVEGKSAIRIVPKGRSPADSPNTLELANAVM